MPGGTQPPCSGTMLVAEDACSGTFVIVNGPPFDVVLGRTVIPMKLVSLRDSFNSAQRLAPFRTRKARLSLNQPGTRGDERTHHSKPLTTF